MSQQNSSNKEQSQDNFSPAWKKLQTISSLLTSLLIPIVIAFVGSSVNSTIKSNELGLRYVELAVEILKEEPKSETENLRKWAVEIVNNYASVKLKKAAQKELETGRLISLFSKFEGRSLFVEYNALGQQIIGYGHVLTSEEMESGWILIGKEKVKYENGITDKQAQVLLEQDLEPIYIAIEKYVKVKLTPAQHDALTSFIYNIGIKNFKHSTLLKVLNMGRYDEIPTEMRRWNKAGGQVLPGLTKRRESEIEVWYNPQED